MIKTVLLTGLAGPYISTLPIPRAFVVKAKKNYNNKSLVNIKERGNSSLLDQKASKQNGAVQTTEPESKSIRSMQPVPLHSKGVFESKEIQGEEVRVYSEAEKNIDVLIKKNVSHKEDIVKDYFNENLRGKPTDTKSSGTIRIEQAQRKYPYKILDLTIKDTVSDKEDIARNYFNDNLDGKPTDTKSSGTSRIEEAQRKYPYKILDLTIKNTVSDKEDIARNYFNDNLDGKPTDPKRSGTIRIEEAQRKYPYKILDVTIKNTVSHKEDIAKDYFNDNLDVKPTDTKSSGTSRIEVVQKKYPYKIVDVTMQKNISHKEDIAKYYINDNLDRKPIDTKSSGTSRVEEEQINDSFKNLDVTTPDIDQEEDFFNDYPDGKKNDPKIMYKQTLIDGYSPYAQRLLQNEKETPDTVAPSMKNISYDKIEKPPTGKNKTYNDLAKLYLNSSNNFAQKPTGPVYSNNYTKDINSRAVQPILHKHSKITMNDKLPAETNTYELAKRFLYSNKNHRTEAVPVINNIKLTSKNQRNRAALPNVPNNRKISENINPLMGISSRYGKPRIPKRKTKSFLNEIEINKKFDDIARRCLKLPINKVDEIILEHIAKPCYKQKHSNTCMKKKGEE